MDDHHDVPILAFYLQKCCRLRRYRTRFCQGSTFVLTFIAYLTYNLSRRPLAVAKNSLNKDSRGLKHPVEFNSSDGDNWFDWEPFQNSNADRLLSILDAVFISSYAISMFLSGMIAESVNLRYFMSIGMLLCGVFTYLFGIAYYLNIHSYAYFVLVLVLDGAAQSTGWPCVVACVGSWFGRNRRGLIFGIWNSHMYTGNIIGSYVAGYFVKINWGLSFIVPAAIIGGAGFLQFLFLIPHPLDVGCSITDYSMTQLYIPQFRSPSEESQIASGASGSSFLNYADLENDNVNRNESDSSLRVEFRSPSSYASETDERNANIRRNSRTVSFCRILKVPGVLEFSLCLFFVKLVSYTFLFWLPRYLAHIAGKDAQEAAYISIAFDVGSIFGGIAAGALLDKSEASALTSILFLALSVPFLLIYRMYGGVNDIIDITLQLVCGALVNGPYTLITTAVTAELGTHYTLEGHSEALPVVAAIIDGTGSVGAVVGPLLAGMAYEITWTNVFYLMMASNCCAVLCLLRIGCREGMALYRRQYQWELHSPTSFYYLYSCCRQRRETYEPIGW